MIEVTLRKLSSKSRNKRLNVKINGKKFLDQPIKSEFKT